MRQRRIPADDPGHKMVHRVSGLNSKAGPAACASARKFLALLESGSSRSTAAGGGGFALRSSVPVMNVLALETDAVQADAIRHVVCDLVGARLTVATSVEHVLHLLRTSVPDLVLLPALVSPR